MSPTSILLLIVFGFVPSENVVAGKQGIKESLWGYYLESDVKEYLELDLDKASLEEELRIGGESNFHSAEELYKRGGFSSTYALLELVDVSGLASPIKKGTLVLGESEQGREIEGEIIQNLDIGEKFIPVLYRYPPYDRYTNYTCVVGSLPTIGIQMTNGCFQTEGSIAVEFISGRDIYNYKYNLLEDNRNKLALRMLSKNAEAEMLLCNGDNSCPHPVFKKYFQYYRVPDYGDRWVMAAFALSSTSLYRGNADFSIYKRPYFHSKKAQAEAIKLGVTCLNLWMYFIHKLNVAVKVCDDGENDITSWEQALALYTGSFESNNKAPGISQNKGEGRMLHAMADSLCMEFKTCHGKDGISGPSMVSSRIFKLFLQGQKHLKERECTAAREIKNSMEGVMIIPLLQGLQIHTYQRSIDLTNKNITDLQKDEDEAKSAAYAASVLPLLHACSPKDAQNLYGMLKVGSSDMFDLKVFGRVKTILERHYGCMGVTCQDIGVLYNPSTKQYLDGVPSCKEHSLLSEIKEEKFVVRGILVGVFLLIILLICTCKRDNQHFSNMFYYCVKRRDYSNQEQDEIPLTRIKNKWIV